MLIEKTSRNLFKLFLIIITIIIESIMYVTKIYTTSALFATITNYYEYLQEFHCKVPSTKILTFFWWQVEGILAFQTGMGSSTNLYTGQLNSSQCIISPTKLYLQLCINYFTVRGCASYFMVYAHKQTQLDSTQQQNLS